MSKILNTYNRKKISFSKGKGSFLYATNGKKYLDFVQGIAVNCLGHANDYLIKSINIGKRIFVSDVRLPANKDIIFLFSSIIFDKFVLIFSLFSSKG